MKILTFGFDDCEIYDRRVCDLMRRCGLKATFYLISGQLGMKVPFHRYGQDTVVERVSAAELAETYRGLEIASHTRAHSMDAPDLAADIERSLSELSEWSGQRVCGLAYPGGQYTAAQADAVRTTRVEYARGASPTHTLSIPKDWYAWEPSCHYADEETPALIDEFLAAPQEETLLLHIFGHSYELTNPDARHNWGYFEKLLERLAGRRDVEYMTNGEAVRALENRREG